MSEHEAEVYQEGGDDVREITLVKEGAPSPPPIVRESKYPWRDLAEADPLEGFFFVGCEDREEAKTLRQSVYASGKNYYQKRGYELIPVVRTMQNEDGQWGVGAWVKLEEQEEEEED